MQLRSHFTSHKIVTEDVCQNVTTAECTHSTVTTLPAPAGVYYGKREAEADPQLLVGAVPAVVPYHNCVNKVTEVCYPVQKVEPTTVTEQSCLVSETYPIDPTWTITSISTAEG